MDSLCTILLSVLLLLHIFWFWVVFSRPRANDQQQHHQPNPRVTRPARSAPVERRSNAAHTNDAGTQTDIPTGTPAGPADHQAALERNAIALERNTIALERNAVVDQRLQQLEHRADLEERSSARLAMRLHASENIRKLLEQRGAGRPVQTRDAGTSTNSTETRSQHTQTDPDPVKFRTQREIEIAEAATSIDNRETRNQFTQTEPVRVLTPERIELAAATSTDSRETRSQYTQTGPVRVLTLEEIDRAEARHTAALNDASAVRAEIDELNRRLTQATKRRETRNQGVQTDQAEIPSGVEITEPPQPDDGSQCEAELEKATTALESTQQELTSVKQALEEEKRLRQEAATRHAEELAKLKATDAAIRTAEGATSTAVRKTEDCQVKLTEANRQRDEARDLNESVQRQLREVTAERDEARRNLDAARTEAAQALQVQANVEAQSRDTAARSSREELDRVKTLGQQVEQDLRRTTSLNQTLQTAVDAVNAELGAESPNVTTLRDIILQLKQVLQIVGPTQEQPTAESNPFQPGSSTSPPKLPLSDEFTDVDMGDEPAGLTQHHDAGVSQPVPSTFGTQPSGATPSDTSPFQTNEAGAVQGYGEMMPNMLAEQPPSFPEPEDSEPILETQNSSNAAFGATAGQPLFPVIQGEDILSRSLHDSLFGSTSTKPADLLPVQANEVQPAQDGGATVDGSTDEIAQQIQAAFDADQLQRERDAAMNVGLGDDKVRSEQQAPSAEAADGESQQKRPRSPEPQASAASAAPANRRGQQKRPRASSQTALEPLPEEDEDEDKEQDKDADVDTAEWLRRMLERGKKKREEETPEEREEKEKTRQEIAKRKKIAPKGFRQCPNPGCMMPQGYYQKELPMCPACEAAAAPLPIDERSEEEQGL